MRYFVGISDNSSNTEYGWVYVHNPQFDKEVEEAISVEEFHEIERIGYGHGSFVNKNELKEITQEEFDKYKELWYKWSREEIEEAELTNYVESIITRRVH